MPDRTHLAAAQRPSVLMLGPALHVRGGVSSVELLMMSSLGNRVDIEHVATMDETSAVSRLRIFLHAANVLRSRLRNDCIVHIHFASRGSTLRKLALSWLVLHAKRPLVLHAHGGMYNEFFASLPPLVRHVIRRIVQRASRLVVLSTQWRDFYVRELQVPEDRVTVMHNPVMIPVDAVSPGPGETRFVYLGRISEQKGTFDLIRAFGKAFSDDDTAALHVAGDGDVEGARKLVRQLGLPDRVDVRGWIGHEERDRLFAHSHVFVLPSFYEGLPMAMLESMARGIAVVVTPVGGIPDVVVHEENGLVVQPGDVAGLSRALLKLHRDRDLLQRLQGAARETARHYDVRAYADRLVEMYGDLARQRYGRRAGVAGP